MFYYIYGCEHKQKFVSLTDLALKLIVSSS